MTVLSTHKEIVMHHQAYVGDGGALLRTVLVRRFGNQNWIRFLVQPLWRRSRQVNVSNYLPPRIHASCQVQPERLSTDICKVFLECRVTFPSWTYLNGQRNH